MASLIELLNKLQVSYTEDPDHTGERVEGIPNVSARRQLMRTLIEHLSIGERRDLRDELNSMDLRRDILMQIPEQHIQINIAHLLDLEDILRLRAVSRRWKAFFSYSKVLLPLMLRYWPSDAERACRQSKPLLLIHEPFWQDVFLDEFTALAKRSLRKKHGRQCAQAVIPYGDINIDRFDPTSKEYIQYFHGRIAFKSDLRCITVRSLHRSTYHGSDVLSERHFPTPNRTIIGSVWVLSDQYLVVTSAQSTELFAWSLDDFSLHTITLPAAVAVMVVFDNKVATISWGPDCYLWDLQTGEASTIEKRDDCAAQPPQLERLFRLLLTGRPEAQTLDFLPLMVSNEDRLTICHAMSLSPVQDGSIYDGGQWMMTPSKNRVRLYPSYSGGPLEPVPCSVSPYQRMEGDEAFGVAFGPHDYLVVTYEPWVSLGPGTMDGPGDCERFKIVFLREAPEQGGYEACLQRSLQDRARRRDEFRGSWSLSLREVQHR